MPVELLTLPVMLESWELECCLPHATIGEAWTADLFFEAGERWWINNATERLPDDIRNFGVVEVEGVVLRAARDAQHFGVVASGPICFAAPGVAADERRFRGTFRNDAHDTSDPVIAENQCTGIVRRIQSVAYTYEDQVRAGEEGPWPVAQEPPQDLGSTTEGQFRGFTGYLLTIEFGSGTATTG